jgi:hypothetical protein
MTHTGHELQVFQLDVNTQAKKVVAWGGRRAGRGLPRRGVLFQRFVIKLDAPSFLIASRQMVKVKRQIA